MKPEESNDVVQDGPYLTGALLCWDNPKTGPLPDPPVVPPTVHGCRVPPPRPNRLHFRSGESIGLPASGSRQLDQDDYCQVLVELRALAGDREVLVVDLRQESHLYFGKRAGSWYADRDWVNVGRTRDWILADESARQALALRFGQDQFHAIAQDGDGRVVSVGPPETVRIDECRTEQEVLRDMDPSIHYLRLPVTDHCAPEAGVVEDLRNIVHAPRTRPAWFHFHCHGGDGRTTTFLALYDMMHWRLEHPRVAMPPLDYFVQRQCSLFPYPLDPAPPTKPGDWKYPLAEQRLQCLDHWRQSI